MTEEKTDEPFEVTCPTCGKTTTFTSISGGDGAGSWLQEHREFHNYEFGQFLLDCAFGEFEADPFKGGY